MGKMVRWVAALAAIFLTTTAHGGVLDCHPAGASDYSDPLSRDGLSAVICHLPEPGLALVIVTDPSLSWPVLMTPTQTVSFEEDMLGNKLGLPGLPYFNPELDQVVHFTDPERLFISVTTSDPVTFAPARVWLRVDTLTGRLAITP
ncbi:MAG: hypothetical protein ABJZ90_15860 [Paracoccaceae bacterium]